MDIDEKKISYPPVVGEYAYYDHRCPYYCMITIKERNERVLFGCVFSSKEKYEDTKYIKRHGIIRKIVSKKLRKRGDYAEHIDEFKYYR
jgi:hypothetical protein